LPVVVGGPSAVTRRVRPRRKSWRTQWAARETLFLQGVLPATHNVRRRAARSCHLPHIGPIRSYAPRSPKVVRQFRPPTTFNIPDPVFWAESPDPAFIFHHCAVRGRGHPRARRHITCPPSHYPPGLRVPGIRRANHHAAANLGLLYVGPNTMSHSLSEPRLTGFPAGYGLHRPRLVALRPNGAAKVARLSFRALGPPGKSEWLLSGRYRSQQRRERPFPPRRALVGVLRHGKGGSRSCFHPGYPCPSMPPWPLGCNRVQRFLGCRGTLCFSCAIRARACGKSWPLRFFNPTLTIAPGLIVLELKRATFMTSFCARGPALGFALRLPFLSWPGRKSV